MIRCKPEALDLDHSSLLRTVMLAMRDRTLEEEIKASASLQYYAYCHSMVFPDQGDDDAIISFSAHT